MNKIKKYLLAIALTIGSVGAISSSDLSENSGFDFSHYASAIATLPKTSYAYIADSISSVSATMGREPDRTQQVSAGDDVSVFGTFIVVVLIAGFSMFRRIE